MCAIDQYTQEVRSSINPYNQRASEAIEHKSAVNLPFVTLIKLMKVFMNIWFNLKSKQFYRQLNVAYKFQEEWRKEV